MRALVQRVERAAVRVGGETVCEIGPGLLVLLAITRDDDEARADRLADKVRALRVFADADADGRMNQPLGEREARRQPVRVYGDTRRGNRPSYVAAAPGEIAEPLYDAFARACRERWIVAVNMVSAGVDIPRLRVGVYARRRPRRR